MINFIKNKTNLLVMNGLLIYNVKITGFRN